MQYYVAKVLNGKAAAKEYGIGEKAKYVVAPSGKLFRGFTQNALEVIAFNGVRFFAVPAEINGVCEVPEELLRGAIAGDETLAAVQKKLAAHFGGQKPKGKGSDPDLPAPADTPETTGK